MILTTQQVKEKVRNYGRNSRGTGKLARVASRIPCHSQVVKKEIINETLQYLAGLDYLKVSLWMEWDSPEFLRMLHDFKEEFQDEKLSTLFESERPIDLGCGGIKFNLQRIGAGKYTYVLKSGDVVLKFSNHQATAQFPNTCIEIHSMSCWSPGWKYLFDRILSLLRAYGGTPRQQKVSEFHITADLIGVDYTTTGFHDMTRWIARADDWAIFGEDFTPNYNSRGKGSIMGRFYNKSSEIESGSEAKADFFRNLWLVQFGKVPKHVTRVEFQLRRERIRDFFIDTVEDLQDKLNAVWQYLVNDWCRFTAVSLTESDRKNKNQQRFDNDSLWDFVRSVHFAASTVMHVERKKKVQHVSPEPLRRISVGCLLSLCGIQGMASDDVDGHAVYCYNLIRHEFHEKWKENPDKYMRKIEVKYNHSYMTV